MTSAKLPDLRKEVITEPKTMTEALQGPQKGALAQSNTQ
ncbi:hypothetical protein BFJ71_g17032 [Fusarium oxysporum]|nr:hypothetical protein BFJ71_g17032 [Fusarium oxysporum]